MLNIYITLFTFACFGIAHATNSNISSVIITQQQKTFEQEEVSRNIQDFENWDDGKDDDIDKDEPDDDELPSSSIENKTTCIKFKAIVPEGHTILSHQDITNITDQYINQCITMDRMVEVITHFSSLYTDRGYITTHITIKRQERMKKYKHMKKQEFQSGIVTLTITEGRVENITFGNNSTSDKITSYFITPLANNGLLNTTAIDQTAENLSYIPSYNYKTKIEPSPHIGFSNINITGVRNFPVLVYAETDSIGQGNTGHNRYTLGTKIDNPFKLGDNLNIRYTSTYNTDENNRYSRGFAYTWSMPIKWIRIGINSSHSQYLTTIQDQTQHTSTNGNITSNSFLINGIIFKNKDIKTTLTSAVNIVNSRSHTYGTTAEIQSRTLANIEIGAINNYYTNFGSFFHKITYIKGLGILGSINDTLSSVNHAQFDAIKFYQLYLIKADKVFYNKMPFTFQNIIDAQYAWQDVYSQNQFALGGFYSVRGFRDISIYGSKGILTRNDIDFNVWDYINQNNHLTKALARNGKNGFTLGIFFDIGITSSHLASNTNTSITGINGNNGVLAGAGYKAGYKSKHLQTNVAIAYPLQYPERLHSSVQTSDKQVIYLTMRGTW